MLFVMNRIKKKKNGDIEYMWKQKTISSQKNKKLKVETKNFILIKTFLMK